jgi:hypothetical protein
MKEKEIILNDIKNIKTNTKEERIGVLDERILKHKLFCSLPLNDSTKINKEIAKTILEILCFISCDLFFQNNIEEIKIYELRFEEADGFKILLFLHNIYKNEELKEMISIILGNFYSNIEIGEEGKIIINTLLNSLKKNMNNNLTEISIIENMKRLLRGIISISRNDNNEKLLIDKEITPLLFNLINTSEKDIYENAICLLLNICDIQSVEEKNNIINIGAFNVLYKKLLEISPPPPGKVHPSIQLIIVQLILLY